MLDSLPQISLFDNLNAAQQAMLQTMFEFFACPPGQFVIEQGKPALYLYIILKGGADIHYKPCDGPNMVLTRLKEGDVFGWSAVVGSRKYTSGVKSRSRLETIRIRRETLWELLAQQPETGKIIVNRLALNVSPRWINAHEQIERFIRSERKQG